jgi:hypothetical protein
MSDASPNSAQALAKLARPARRADRRIRLARALEAMATALCVALFAVAVVLVLRKTGHVREGVARGALAVGVLGTFASAVVAYLRPLGARAGAVALDRYHGLSDRLSSALSFAALPASERSPFMQLAIEDGVRAAAVVDPRRAVPLRAPRDLPVAAGLLLATIGIGLFEVRVHVPIAVARTIDAVDVTADDLDAMREFLRDQAAKDESDEAKAATQEFNQLIEDLAQRRLDRTEAFRHMQALEDKLLEGREADKKALEDALQKIGEEMKKAALTKPAGEALDSKNLPLAEKEMRELAKKLREQGGQIDKGQLEKMREALKEAAKDNAARQQAIAERRDELEKDLLRKKQQQPDGGASDEEKSLLKKKERELERLNREDAENQAAERQLDRLDRELAQAAEDLMRDLDASAKDLEHGAEDINQMARNEMTQEEKEQMKQKLDELREMLRQQGQGGKKQMVRLRRFQSRARGGQQGQSGQGQGQPGQDQQGEGQEGDQGQNGQAESGRGQKRQGQQGQGGQNGQGQNGQGGQGQGNQGQGGEEWIVGPNGEKVLMLSQSSGQGQGGGHGSQGGGEGTGAPNPHGWGTDHDEHVQGAATNTKVGTEDTQVAGQDTGQGATRSEVIQGAAERGFASHGYTKVYREYHAVAEEAIGKDEIPGGYRFYVRRYFQLIRPRE